MPDIYESFADNAPDDIDLDAFQETYGYKDALSQRRRVPPNPASFLRGRVVETLQNYVQFLHSLLMPSPKNLIANSQSNAIDEDDEDLASDLIDEYTAVLTRNRMVNAGSSSEQAFLDDAITTWNRTQEDLQHVIATVHDHWEGERHG